jgi:L,D-transpeptidase ErfK/SrfK
VTVREEQRDIVRRVVDVDAEASDLARRHGAVPPRSRPWSLVKQDSGQAVARRSSAVLVAALLLGLLAREAAPVEAAPGLSALVVGGPSTYAAEEGDSLTSVGARFGVDVVPLARTNGLAPDAWLRLGQVLRIENPHVVPAFSGEVTPERIVINIPQRLLFLFHDGVLVAHFPVGLGRPRTPTPLGRFTIARREFDKTWYVPPSIQEEMRREGKPVRTRVPPGPDNPLGRHWLGLGDLACGIHGTIAPASIYHWQTHGCIRLHPDDVAWLFDRVTLGDGVEIVYLPVLLAALPDGRIFLEVHRDVYGREEPPLVALERLAAAHDLAARLDWKRAARVVEEAEGLARDVSASASDGPAGGARGGER